MKVLICGGAGYIGSHMVRELVRAEHDVLVFDNFSTGHRAAIGSVPLYLGDLLQPADIDQMLSAFRPQLVMHFAARSLVAESVADPALYYDNNVGGVHNLLQGMRRHGVNRLVFSSTAAVYGQPMTPQITESHPTSPINPYGRSKLFAERIIEDHCSAYGVRAAVLRYFNAAGADISGDLGEAHEPETHLLPNLLRVAAGRVSRIKLFGNDFDTPDGFCVRDFIHVSDLSNAHLLAAKALEDANLPAFQCYNLGNGTGFSVIEVLRAAEEITARPIPWDLAPRRNGDPAVLVASAEKAHRLLGWQPRLPELKTIIETAWRWHQAPRY